MKCIDFELALDEDIDVFFKNVIVTGGKGTGGIYVYSTREELPIEGNQSYLYIIRDLGTFYWDALINEYVPIPLYEAIKEKIWITADNYEILTADNKIFKPNM